MTTFDVILLAIVSCGLLILLFCAWVLHCNQKTSRAREGLISHVYGNPPSQNPNWRELSALYGQTSYDRHVWDLVFFRDPWKQYDPRLLEGFER